MKFTHTALAKTHTFEVVNKIPEGYHVWNIGENMREGFLPLCESENYHINPETLKALPLKDQELRILKEAAGYGIDDLKTACHAVRVNPRGYMTRKKKDLAVEALPIFEKISA